jgi:hypothetical protein
LYSFEDQGIMSMWLKKKKKKKFMLQGALGILNSSLNELHLRTVNANIGMFGTLTQLLVII